MMMCRCQRAGLHSLWPAKLLESADGAGLFDSDIAVQRGCFHCLGRLHGVDDHRDDRYDRDNCLVSDGSYS